MLDFFNKRGALNVEAINKRKALFMTPRISGQGQ